MFARNYIAECEQRHGELEVELLLDSCHALMNHGVDRYKRPNPIGLREERRRQEEREAYLQSQVNDLWRTIPHGRDKAAARAAPRFPPEPQENILYFIEKNAPLLAAVAARDRAHRAQARAVLLPAAPDPGDERGLGDVLALHDHEPLYDEGLIADGFMLELLHSHTNVVNQPGFDSPYYSGINPYALGFAMYRTSSASARIPTRRTAAGSPTSPARTGARRWTSRCATSRTRASWRSSCRRG